MSRQPLGLVLLLAGVLALLIVIARSLFIAYPWEHVIVLRFGQVVDVTSDPGLHAKLPWDDVLRLESRILTIDTLDADRFITTEKENLLVDSFIKWRIQDPQAFYTSVRGDETQAQVRLLQIINRSLRDEIGKLKVKDIVSGERNELMQTLRTLATEPASDLGIEVVDVRIKRVELPQQVSENVYRNMTEERRRIANERRSTGDAEKEKITAEADKNRTIIIADAQRQAEIIKGEGDAEAARIYANAFGRHPEFYAFYRSLDAYANSFGTGSDFMVLDANTEFFKYFRNQFGDNLEE